MSRSRTADTGADAHRADTSGSRGAAHVNFGLFLVLCLFWGGAFLATKVGVTSVPPVFFAAVRYALVAAILVVFVANVAALFGARVVLRTIGTAVLVNVGTYAFLYWGMQFVASGVSGLVNMALVPVGLFVFAILAGEEKPRWSHALALALGIAGMAVLFSGKLDLAGNRMELLGVAGILLGTLCYCLGTVLSRPLVEAFSPFPVVTAQALVGTAGLFLTSIALEPLSLDTLRALAMPAPLAGMLYLAFAGTIGGYAIYLRLMRDWGPSNAGLYAFISPVVALALGWWFLNEEIGWREIAGAAIMLSGAAVALRNVATR